ncbi:MAG TPA: hypothetical protein VGK19_19905 [Capsulimonadaceae bacterium]
MRHDWDDEFWLVSAGVTASTARTSGATFCGPVPKWCSFGAVAAGGTLSPEGDLLFTGTASADATPNDNDVGADNGMPTARNAFCGSGPFEIPHPRPLSYDKDEGSKMGHLLRVV